MQNFQSKIADIKNEAARLYKLKLNEDQLFDEINEVPNSKLAKLEQIYQGSEGRPVNLMRWEIIRILQSGTRVSVETLDSMIELKNNEAEKNSFKAWGHFSILFPIISSELSFNVKDMMRVFGEELITNLNIEDHVAKPFVVDFKGPRNFGSDNVWMAIYNKSNPKQTTAVQLFLQIDYRGLICHLYDRLKDHFISSRKIEETKDMQEQVEDFFQMVKDKVIEDRNEETEVRYRELGVKSNSLFKISHDPENFQTLEEIQYCIDQNIIVVRGEADNNSQISSFSEYKEFKEAKRGDLFYLCWGHSKLLLIGQILDEKPEDYKYGSKEGWKYRKYRFLFDAVSNESYSGMTGDFTPSTNSNFSKIPRGSYGLVSDIIFKKYFKVELKTDFDTILLPPKIGAASRQKISIDEIVEPKLEVSLIAQELTGVIDNLDKNKGQMIGVFGSWGRGKTFLYKRMHEHIEENEDLRFDYEHYTFNAWKYQETETIWAHLYDSLLDGYIGKSNRWQRFWKTFRLNIARKGWFPIISILASLIGTILFTYLVSTAIKFEAAKWVVAFFGGVVGVIQAVVIYLRFNQPVKAMVQSYASLHNYSEVLGIQSEIQKELVTLVEHWLKKNESGKIRKRLLLFVDDIDRCQEEKIISVLDALRVMLDDEILIDRIVVLVAVDELLLERAILYKYRNFNFKSKNEYSKNLVEEYMDKLFIAGIKLPKLKVDEQAVILRNYAINNDILERVELDQSLNVLEEPESPVNQDSPVDDLIFPDADPRDYFESQSEYFLLEKELDVLNKYSDNLSESVTPRQLRIYMYRYLLAKNIASDFLWQKTGESQLSDDYCDFLAKAIAYRSNAVHSFSFTNDVSLDLINDPTLKKFTEKLVEVVVPY